jgi:hypothetical protein
MRLQLSDGAIFEGAGELEILRAMRNSSIFTADEALGKYIQLLVRNAGIFEHTRLLVCGDSLRARARSLIEQLKAQGLAREV